MRRRPISCRTGLALALAFVGSCLLACDDEAEHPLALVCPTLSSECPPVLPSYANEVAPIIAAHCGQCHSRENPSGPWPLDDLGEIADWASAIQANLAQCLMPPPETDAPLSDADRDTLQVWLMCGAPP